MAQHDFVINNQGFPAFRSDLNDFLNAVRTTHSGTSTPTGAVAGTIWLDTTTATTPTLKYYDGTDNISLATIDHVGNTVNWLDSTVSITGLTTTATGTVLTLSDSASTSTVNLILDNQKEIRFRETTANGTNYVALKAPASLSADATFTLPSTDGTNGQFLSTNGSGVLSFATVGGSTTPFAVIGNATSGSEIRLPEDTDNGSNYIAIKAPDTIASNLTLTLPSADGTSGQVLQTNGSGVLSFAGVSASAGQVIQVLSATDSTQRTTTSSTFVTASNTLSVAITPSSASNKIFVMVNAGMTATGGYFTIFRGATDLGAASSKGFVYADSDVTHAGSMSFLDSPSTTSSITYQVYMRISSGTNILNADGAKGSITVFEIKG